MIRTASGKKIDRRGKCSVVGFWVELYVCSAQSKLAIARLPETTKTLFGQPDFRKNKEQVAQGEFARQPRKKIEVLTLL